MGRFERLDEAAELEPKGLVQRLSGMGHDLVSLASTLMADERGKLFPGENGDRQHHASLARRLFKDRRGRDNFFPSELFGEPAWDILLDLYVGMQRGQPMSTGDPALMARVPPTTALRYLQVLEAEGLLERAPDPDDRRRTFVRLSSKGEAAMTAYLRSLLA